MEYLLLFEEALKQDNPYEALVETVKLLTSEGAENYVILAWLYSAWKRATTPENRKTILDVMEILTPNASLSATGTEQFKTLFVEALNGQNPFKQLRETIVNLRSKGVDKGIILLELFTFSENHQKSEQEIEVIADIGDCIYGWCRPELRID